MIEYLRGFGNHFQSEAMPQTLPSNQNNPQKPAYGLYTEQISGSAFTMARPNNARTWLYKIMPSSVMDPMEHYAHPWLESLLSNPAKLEPQRYRWDPLPLHPKKQNFIDAWIPWVINGNPQQQTGGCVYLLQISKNMNQSYFWNSDGELLFLSYHGSYHLQTEMGSLKGQPGEIVVIPRGIKFNFSCKEPVMGYLLENYGQPFMLPERGVIGANGLANERDFKYPQAEFFDETGDFELICKYNQHFWRANTKYHPLDVVAWHGNYLPYKYNLADFVPMGCINIDHADPSILTVLTSPSSVPGMANIDFVIFPNRWMVAKDSFRPPYFHRNIMNEYMGLIKGKYDGKQAGFKVGGSSLHNCMLPHGPDAAITEKAKKKALRPEYLENTLAFMFESRYVWRPSGYALENDTLQEQYSDCWGKMARSFAPPPNSKARGRKN